MKTKFVSLSLCAVVVTLASSVYAGDGRPGFRPIQRANAALAAQARSDDTSSANRSGSRSSNSVMTGSMFHPTQSGMGGADQFKGLFDKPGNR